MKKIALAMVFILFTLFCAGCGQDKTELGVSTEVRSYSLNFVSSDPVAGQVTGNTEQKVAKGKKSEKVVAVPNLGYKFVRWSNGELNAELTVKANKDETFSALFQIDALELPIIRINTQNTAPIVSKEEYLKCDVSVSNTDGKYCFDKEPARIRGRGNSTWNMPKKPYKLKFDSKIDLFGNGKAKTWALIADYADPSLIRNYLAYSVGAVFEGLNGYTTTTQHVDLYLNGEYRGVYLVCEQTETGKTRVDIPDDLIDKTTGKAVPPQDIGYLIEMDSFDKIDGTEGKDYFVLYGKPYGIKSPDTDDGAFSYGYVDYISQYVNDCLRAIAYSDINTVGQLVDLESFASTYIVHELFNSVDCGYSSFYMYKKPDGKLYSGPLWDFDISVGNCDYHDEATNPRYLWARTENIWYNLLFRFDEFRAIVKTQLLNYRAKIQLTIDVCVVNVKLCKNSFNRNFDRWQTLGKWVWPNTPELVAIGTWEGHLNYVKGWLTESLDYMVSVYSS